MEFATTVTYVDIWNHGAEDCNASEASVKWSAEMDCRSWGVKSIDVSVISVTCNATKTISEDEEQEMEIDSSDGWTIETEGLDSLNMDNVLCPHNVSIDFKDKTITVNF